MSSIAASNLPVYVPIEFVENLEQYRPGGYHPVQIGTSFDGERYTILNKLGSGGYSTVWFARDEKQAQFVTVKIVVAARPSSKERAIRELLNRAGQQHPGSRYIQRLLGAFFEQGPNGTHECLVSVPGGFSLLTAKEFPGETVYLFRLEVARALVAQMILATSFVHSLNIVHGDLHLDNFLLRLPPGIQSLSTEAYSHRYQYHTEAIKRFDARPLTESVPPYAVFPHGVGKPCRLLELEEAGVLLTDFGTSWDPSEESCFRLGTPIGYLPPESVFAAVDRCAIDLSADIWTLAHSLHYVYAEDMLFTFIGPCNDQHNMIAEAVDLLGKPPQSWWDTWTARDQFFDRSGNWDPKGMRSAPHGGSLSRRVQKMLQDRSSFDACNDATFGKTEFEDFLAMLASMLKWSPESRISSKELETCSWMRHWGLPALTAAEALAERK